MPLIRACLRVQHTSIAYAHKYCYIPPPYLRHCDASSRSKILFTHVVYIGICVLKYHAFYSPRNRLKFDHLFYASYIWSYIYEPTLISYIYIYMRFGSGMCIWWYIIWKITSPSPSWFKIHIGQLWTTATPATTRWCIYVIWIKKNVEFSRGDSFVCIVHRIYTNKYMLAHAGEI